MIVNDCQSTIINQIFIRRHTDVGTHTADRDTRTPPPPHRSICRKVYPSLTAPCRAQGQGSSTQIIPTRPTVTPKSKLPLAMGEGHFCLAWVIRCVPLSTDDDGNGQRI